MQVVFCIYGTNSDLSDIDEAYGHRTPGLWKIQDLFDGNIYMGRPIEWMKPNQTKAGFMEETYKLLKNVCPSIRKKDLDWFVETWYE